MCHSQAGRFALLAFLLLATAASAELPEHHGLTEDHLDGLPRSLLVKIGSADLCAGKDCSQGVGECQTGSCKNGKCIYQNKPMGEACAGGTCKGGLCQLDLCAGMDCSKGVGECKRALPCVPSTGKCPTPEIKPAGTPCTGGICRNGVCQQGKCAKKQCQEVQPGEECKLGGGCNPATGQCITIQNKQDGATCQNDQGKCHGGICNVEISYAGALRLLLAKVGPADLCAGKDCSQGVGECQTGSCKNGKCIYLNKPLGEACTGGTCKGGLCQLDLCAGKNCSEGVGQCQTALPCRNGRCTYEDKPQGTACTGGTCRGGVCQLDLCAGKDCSQGVGECKRALSCVPSSGKCPAPEIKPAGTLCTGGICRNGVCQKGKCAKQQCAEVPAGEECKQGGGCNPANGKCNTIEDKQDGTLCQNDEGKCQGGACIVECLAENVQCDSTNGPACCSGLECQSNEFGLAIQKSVLGVNASSDEILTWKCIPKDACFSGDTTVIVKESSTPVAMRDLQIGQHIQCVDSGEDLTKPATVQWCPVMNFPHAEARTLKQARISYTHSGPAGGSTGSCTVSPTHLVLRLTSDALVGATAAHMTAFGSFETVQASTVRVDDRLVLLADPADTAAGFVVAAVSSVETVNAEGMYMPAVEMPYIIAGGVVVPLHSDKPVPIIAPSEVHDPKSVILQYATSLLFMTREQPLGTPGSQASWDGAPVWPGTEPLERVTAQKAMSGLAVNFTAAREWFMPRYAAWKADNTAVITARDALDFFDSDAAWTPVSPRR